MEDSLENLISYLEMEDDILNESNSSFDEQEFLREIIQQPDDVFGLSAVETSFSHVIENLKAMHTPSDCIQTGSLDGSSLGCKLPCSNTIQQNNIVEGWANSPTNSSNLSFDETIYENNTLNKSNSSNSLMSLEMSVFSPTTCLLSFDNSNVDEQVINEPKSHNFPIGSKRKRMEKDEFEKKARRSSPKTQTIDHLLAERKRRRELTESIIQLSAMIPGLKKMDKAYVLHEAVNYTKQLQNRVKELENQNEAKRVNSAISIWKSQASSNKSTKNTESLLEVEVRVLEKNVLVRILCEKQMDIMVKTLVLLQKLQLSITSTSVLPFGTSILVNNIIAQMDDEHSMATDDLVKNLRECLPEAHDMH